MSTYQASRDLAYKPEQLFDLAADIERYPEFVPWWIAAKVHRREGSVYYTDQVVGYGAFRQRFGSRTELQRPSRILVSSTDTAFRAFKIDWRFDPLPGAGCRVELGVDLELRSPLAQKLFRRTISHTVGSLITVFEAHAHQLYGPAHGAP